MRLSGKHRLDMKLLRSSDSLYLFIFFKSWYWARGNVTQTLTNIETLILLRAHSRICTWQPECETQLLTTILQSFFILYLKWWTVKCLCLFELYVWFEGRCLSPSGGNFSSCSQSEELLFTDKVIWLKTSKSWKKRRMLCNSHSLHILKNHKPKCSSLCRKN